MAKAKRIRRTPTQISDGITIEDIKAGIKTLDEKVKSMPKTMNTESLEKANLESDGIGNVVSSVLKATGVNKVVNFIAGEDCGCDERRKKLNALLKTPTLCLTEDEYNALAEILIMKPNEIGQGGILKMRQTYARIKGIYIGDLGTCGGCMRTLYKNLQVIFSTYA